MKVWVKALLPILSVALLFAIAGCEGEQGPAGPSGAENCTSACHTDDFQMDDYIVAVQTEFDLTLHNTGDTYMRRGSTSRPECSACHTSEGYAYYVANGTAVALDQSSRIGCFGCHAPHSTESFNLRQVGGYDLLFGGVAYDKGNANTCGNCHQARVPSPAIDDTANDITSQYWGAHHGPQANVLVGSGLHVYPGGNAYSTSHSHNGGIESGCVGCHMAALPNDGLAGGHSFAMLYNYHGGDHVNDSGCSPCHDSDDVTDRVETAKDAFTTRLDALAANLLTLQWIKADLTHVDEVNIPADADARGSVVNYLALLEDRSGGIHNPTYADAVLSATETYVTSQLP